MRNINLIVQKQPNMLQTDVSGSAACKSILWRRLDGKSRLKREPKVEISWCFLLAKCLNGLGYFVCKYNDPLYVKLEKIAVMVQLASERNIDQVLSEFREYASEAWRRAHGLARGCFRP